MNSQFKLGRWNDEIDVKNFIQLNHLPYDGDSKFLCGPSIKTKNLWRTVKNLLEKERLAGGVLGINSDVISRITSHEPGYIDKKNEEIVGLQTSEPLVRSIMPYGGIKMVKNALNAYDNELNPKIEEIFKHRKTHNDGVFDVYSKKMRLARHNRIITGLPDSYGRGRIIGDYRRVALYGVDHLIEGKLADLAELEDCCFSEEIIRLREEIADQIKSLEELKIMANSYGFNISNPAQNLKEAIQWLYFGYLAATKEQNGAAMSIGRISTFLDIFAERDLNLGILKEEDVQSLVDGLIIKLRIIRFLRTPDYNQLFSGDPVWVTESIGGVRTNGEHLVTKMSYRFLQSLINLGPAPEPNLTVLWSQKLPLNFKKFACEISVRTSAIQFENDDIMRETLGDDYAIACCVSPMKIGEQMQFFGARCNLAKALLYALNGGKDEISLAQVGPRIEPVNPNKVLDYSEVIEKFNIILDWLCETYINSLNVIHYMHDKYCYEKIQMALHNSIVERKLACGIAGLSIVTDSLSAIKFAKVKPIVNEHGIITNFEIEGDFPKFGNNVAEVDNIAVSVVKKFSSLLKKHKTYRNSTPTLSILTITSNIIYGEKTGATPDGRENKIPFSPGANPMNGRDSSGAIAAMKSVAKLPFNHAQDGISFTFSITPNNLGKTIEERTNNLVQLLDGYFADSGHHINVNVLDREVLLDAIKFPSKYPTLTIRVSGYAVNFIKLTKKQQLDVLSRTFHSKI